MEDEWVDWHRGYSRAGALPRRLEVVQAETRAALDRTPARPVRVVSLCAGDGRDLLGVLRDYPRAGEVRARLIDLTPELVTAGRREAAARGWTGIELVVGDASTTDALVGAVPADLVLLCGIFGNVTDEDVRATIEHLPEICAPGATVIWTRGRFPPDLTPTIRDWFRNAGFDEIAFTAIPGSTASVGAHRLAIPPRPFVPGVRLFTFLPKEQRPSSRAGSPTAAPAAGSGPP